MHNIDQHTVDERIHRFMARKSPWKTFSETIADHLTAQADDSHKGVGIAYEQTRWRGSRLAR